MNNSCSAGCIQVEKIFQNAEQRDLPRDDTGGNPERSGDDDYEMSNDPRLLEFPCFLAIQGDDHGHFNYAVMSYAVANHHNECLKTLHQQIGASWHGGLAECAAEDDNLEALMYIVEKMGYIDDTDHLIDGPKVSVRCQNYLKTFPICKTILIPA